MPSMPERMAVVETKVAAIYEDTRETKTNVNALVTWMTEERAARAERQRAQKRSERRLAILTGALGTLAGTFGGIVYKAFGG